MTVFVFGSNLAGRHGAGAALWAVRHAGAVYGQGEGPQGDSYAIPTKDGRGPGSLRDPRHTLPLSRIKEGVDRFIAHAAAHRHVMFSLTPIGCGLAGYTPEQIAPLFRNAPSNVIMPPEFEGLVLL